MSRLLLGKKIIRDTFPCVVSSGEGLIFFSFWLALFHMREKKTFELSTELMCKLKKSLDSLRMDFFYWL